MRLFCKVPGSFEKNLVHLIVKLWTLTASQVNCKNTTIILKKLLKQLKLKNLLSLPFD
jgi:hypothetical protein